MPGLRTLAPLILGLPASQGRNIGRRKAQVADATFAYGPHPLQAWDLHAAGKGQRPLIVFLHGGAWQFGDKARRLQDRKAAFARSEGWHLASVNFRLVPEVGVGDMAADIAAALADMLVRADALSIDPARIVLMGHSSGAHLAALVGTDGRYLGAHGLAPDCLAGVIAIDGAAYDATRPSAGPWFERRLVTPAFPEPARTQLSPVHHVDNGPNARRFLVLHAARTRGEKQARWLEQALAAVGARVERHGFAGAGIAAHVALSRRFGETGFGPTEVTRRWLADLRPAPSPAPVSS